MRSLNRTLLSSAAVWPLSVGLVMGAVGLVAAAGWDPDRADVANGAATNPLPAKKADPRPSGENPNSTAGENPVAVTRVAAACSPCAAKKTCGACSPCAAKAGVCNPCAAKNPCKPCAANTTVAPCNPCAAKNPCSPCAANPCNLCAPGGGAMLLPTECEVPSLRQAALANPSAAKKQAATGPCNPCAAKTTAAPCNPCAAKNPCNPCAAKNPCNPCTAKKADAGGPCAVQRAAAPCNPCAAKNPCAAQSPCAAKNPCNPCAAATPCNPCAASAPEVEVPDQEMLALYDCLKPKMLEAYAAGGHWAAGKWGNWEHFSTRGYRSETHGGRFVQNAANELAAKEYGKFEEAKKMPTGSTVAKPSFVVSPDGQASIGPLFIMEKMTRGWNDETGNWRYAMIMPNGSTFGITKGQNSAGMGFCNECHAAAENTDYMMFMPEEFRRK